MQKQKAQRKQMSSREETHPETRQQRKQQVADKLTFSFRRYDTTVVPENVLPLNAVRYNYCTRHKYEFLTPYSTQSFWFNPLTLSEAVRGG
ncbi:hypothetical protein AVEN_222347-1 [Araneus ventricosus]|uniref:Uncharacterized protein n=1 Tax=Araneus ventricosus TaxID=182803 RepID=A0A4Y2UL71_ARAVE|nr:hypothetical protein AVEN_222347-1 [Araneus ventricosus]